MVKHPILRWALPIIVLAVMAGGIAQAARLSNAVERHVVAGGGSTAAGGEFRLTGTIGQVAVSTMTGGDFSLHSGFLAASAAAETPETGEHSVTVGNNSYSPAVLTIRVGETVTWQRQEGFHSVTADDGAFDQAAGTDWQTFSVTFATAGAYPYHCTVHGGPGGVGMSGTVIVQEADAGREHQIFLPFVTED